MFREKTTLILGAGASKPYGFPLGYELIDDIINCIKNDAVLFPITTKNRNLLRSSSLVSIDDYAFFSEERDILKVIRESIKNGNIENISKYKKSYIDYSKNSIDDLVYGIFCSHDLIRIKLNYIKELTHLAQMLEDFDPVSIDAFLRDHPEHKIAGQTMIMYCLLKYHDSSKFKKNTYKNSTNVDAVCELEKTKTAHDNWYRYLLNDIKTGCQTASAIMENNLSILTFNYDLSLDFYLKDRLTRTSFFSDYANQYVSDRLKIEHIYGSICDFNEISDFYDLKQNDISDVAQEIINFHHLLYGYLESSSKQPRIKLIGDRVSDQTIKERIKYSEKIVFIGFGFDRDNLDVLGFPCQKSKYKDFFIPNSMGGIANKKKIFYLDFGGKMQNLNNEFMELETISPNWNNMTPWLKITRSTNTSITDAYVNDFREGLFTIA